MKYIILVILVILAVTAACYFLLEDTIVAVNADSIDDTHKDFISAVFPDRSGQSVSKGVRLDIDKQQTIIGIMVKHDVINIQPDELDRISGFKDLRWIDLRGQPVLYGRLSFLENYQYLETLNLSQSGIDDSDIEDIVGLDGIATLLLDESNITDGGVKILLDGLDVQYLHMSGCNNLTNAICDHIANTESLQAVYISGTQVDQKHILDLHNRRPGLAIAWTGGK